MADTDDSAKPRAQRNPNGYRWWSRLVAYMKRKTHERITKREEENPEPRSIRWTMWSTVAIAVFTVVLACVSYFQLREMKQGSVESGGQMNQMIDQSRRQVAQLSKQAGDTHDLAVRTKDLADRMKDQADQTRTIANQAIIQADATKSAAKAASKQLELIDRPWVAVTFTPESPIAFSGDQMQLSLRVHFKNAGHAVATNIAIPYDAFLTNDPFNTVLSRQKVLCDKAAKDKRGMNGGRLEMTLFPSAEDNSLWIGANIYMSEIMANLIDTHLTPTFHEKVFGPIYLVGCVDYQYAASPTHHQTRFAYQIGRALPNSPPDVVAAIKVGESVPVEDVRMARWIFGGDQAY